MQCPAIPERHYSQLQNYQNSSETGQKKLVYGGPEIMKKKTKPKKPTRRDISSFYEEQTNYIQQEKESVCTELIHQAITARYLGLLWLSIMIYLKDKNAGVFF